MAESFAYYNEFDKNAAAWLRELIKNGLIANGEVDERSIIDVEAKDLKGYSQHHFFSGIGGWSYALRLAGWSDSRPVCTASLPCQPFSAAGKQLGKSDERHLLPHFIELVKQCNFPVIFGEQVPAAIKHGWLDDLHDEMERENYAVGSIVLTAAGEGAPHIRQRIYWVADNISDRSQGRLSGRQDSEREAIDGQAGHNGAVSRMVYANGDGSQQGRVITQATGHRYSFESASGISRMGNPQHNGHATSEIKGSNGTSVCDSKTGQNSTGESERASASRAISEWHNPDWLYCRGNKYRPIKAGIEPLVRTVKSSAVEVVDGISERMVRSGDSSQRIDADNTQEARVMRLKGYGNAIVPQVAASFISAFMEINYAG